MDWSERLYDTKVTVRVCQEDVKLVFKNGKRLGLYYAPVNAADLRHLPRLSEDLRLQPSPTLGSILTLLQLFILEM